MNLDDVLLESILEVLICGIRFISKQYPSIDYIEDATKVKGKSVDILRNTRSRVRYN